MGTSPTKATPSGAVVVCPVGRLDVTAAPGLREQLRTVIDAGDSRVVVDMSGVDAIDSSGLGALLYGLKAARQAGGDLRIVAPNQQVRSVLDVTRVNTLLTSCRTADEAFGEEPTGMVLETTAGPGTLDAVQRTLEQAWSAGAAVPDTIRTNVATAAAEVVSNIVEHAARRGPVDIRMDVSVLPGEVRLEFTDNGSPADIDLSEVRMPDPMADRGRGLAIALAFLSDLSYRRDESGNHWTLVSERFG